MNKLEMVIKGLECCINDTARADKCWGNGDYPECPYNHDVDRCMDRLDRDALALLKAREPVEPVRRRRHGQIGYSCFCGMCGYGIGRNEKYCALCGRAVKWDA